MERDARLQKIARGYSREMARSGEVVHISSKSGAALDRVRAAGLSPLPSALAENVGRAFSTREVQTAFMGSPGHRANILNAEITHVGIGVAYGAGSLRMIELFGRRYADLEAVPFRARLKDHLVVSGRLLRRSDSLLGISVFHEPLPQSMNRAELNATSSYSLPKEERMERPRLLAAHYSDGSGGTVHVSGRAFQMPLSFWKGKGVYTIAVWIDAGGKTSFIGAMTSVFVE